MNAAYQIAKRSGPAILGFVALVTALLTPPEEWWLFVVVGGIGVAAVLLGLRLGWARLSKTKPWMLLLCALVALLVFFVALVRYVRLQRQCIIFASSDVLRENPVYFPLDLPNQSREYIAQHGGSRQGAVDSVSSAHVDEDLRKDPEMERARAITSIVMLLTFVVCSTALAVAFGLIGVRLAPSEPPPDDDEEPEPPPDCGLPGPLFRQLQKAVGDAFSEGDLEELMRVRLEVNLWGIVARGSGNQVAFRLILWLLRRGRLPEFLSAIEAERPDKVEVVEAVRDVRAVL